MPSRRDFLRASAAATGTLAAPAVRVRALQPDPVRIGLVGCGGRGTGAVRDCLTADAGVELVALGDVFADRIARARGNLAEWTRQRPDVTPRLQVTDERCFTGFDAYRRVIDAGIDLVLLATPPAFRPAHLAHAIAQGKHVFMEKPVAVDPTGVRAVIAASDAARERNLAIVAGTQRRHDVRYLTAVRRLHDGAIGKITSGRVFWNQGGLWINPREPAWSDVEWQLRNWLYFTWLSGDHIVEQHIHNLDVANWVLRGHPVRAVGVGGRQWRTDPAYGHIYDHFAVDFEYPSGAHVLSMCRQIDGTASQIAEFFAGAQGRSDANTVIEGRRPWRWDTRTRAPNPYEQEHADLLASIRAGRPLNEGRQVAESTLTAIMGREAAYTGQEITWDALLTADQDLVPSNLAFGPMPVAPVAIPGVTTLTRSWRI